MAYLKNVDEIRAVEWYRSYLWDIVFPEAPSPFNKWFPAVDVEETLYNLDTFAFEGGMSSFEVPKGTTPLQLSVTFKDNEDLVLHNWLSDWVNKTILNDGMYVTPLEECVKIIQVAKLKPNRAVFSEISYQVIPKGSLSFHGTSDSSSESNTISFVVIGKN